MQTKAGDPGQLVIASEAKQSSFGPLALLQRQKMDCRVAPKQVRASSQ